MNKLPVHLTLLSIAFAVSLTLNENGAAISPCQQADGDLKDGQGEIVKIWIEANGVLIDSKTIPFKSLETNLETLGDVKEIWYHEESDEVRRVEDVSPIIYQFARRRNIPLSVYRDRKYKDLVFRVKNLPVIVDGDAGLLAEIRDANKSYHEILRPANSLEQQCAMEIAQNLHLNGTAKTHESNMNQNRCRR